MNTEGMDKVVRNKNLSKLGRCAVVTGAAEGLGRAYAIRLAEDGADIAIIDARNAAETERAIRALGRKVRAHRCDMTDGSALETAARAILSEFGRCDILINNPDDVGTQFFQDLGYEALRHALALNIEAPFVLCKTLMPAMRAAGWGRVINISTSTVNRPVPHLVSEITAKAGIVGLTRGLATEFGPAGITVNAIAPGIMESDARNFDGSGELPSFTRKLVPGDLVGAVSFLASDDASFITAQVLHVDAGLTRV